MKYITTDEQGRVISVSETEPTSGTYHYVSNAKANTVQNSITPMFYIESTLLTFDEWNKYLTIEAFGFENHKQRIIKKAASDRYLKEVL